MSESLNILFVSSECVPFVKTGGLADVVGSLPLYLKKMGHNVKIIIPNYSKIDHHKHGILPHHGPMGVWMGNWQEWCLVHMTYLQQDIPVFFIDFSRFFGRDGFYHDKDMNDYLDNAARFSFLSRAALQFCIDIGFKADIVHSHDWQTAPAAAYLKTWHWNDPILGKAASVLTIHNISYQGVYPKDGYEYLGFGEANFHTDGFEDHGKVNLLKGGINFADVVNTVSPGYAAETRTPEGGKGLAPYLNNKGENYLGILNGVDYNIWNPSKDTHIAANYDIGKMKGKEKCKADLQDRFLLERRNDIPIIGIVSRFVSQKGLDKLAQVIESIVQNMAVQFAILGSGSKALEDFFGGLPARYPGKIGAFIGYNEDLAHKIEAGSDFFLMPSDFEPCGLNQIYSLRYGTLPIVRATGGLEDTVINYQEDSGEGTGFKFYDLSAHAIYFTVGWAVSTWYDRPDHYKAMQKKGMQQQFSWEKSAAEYLKLYRKAIANKKALSS